MADSTAEASEQTKAQSEKDSEGPESSSGVGGESQKELKDSRPEKPSNPWIKRLLMLGVLIGLIFGAVAALPTIRMALDTVSTDDAYINGHVTMLASRVSGQVSKVLVDDNMRVRRGDILVQLDREPYEIQLAISKAAVVSAEASLAQARAGVRGELAQAGSYRYQLERSMEDVKSKLAELRSDLAALGSARATLELARANLARGEQLLPGGGISKEDVDLRRQSVKVDESNVEQALQKIYSLRAGLGLTAKPAKEEEMGQTPPDLDQTYSGVRQALAQLIQSGAQFGYFPSSQDASPKDVLTEFYRLDPEGNLDRILAKLLPQAPEIKVAEAKLLQARSDLAKVELDLRYCNVVSEIDGVVTRRNVNTGNNVQMGQNLMAVRSEWEIWVDANYKESQLTDLRIGQRVVCRVDMYGKGREFEGRITGFTMGTGQTLSLLPAQNATGNFVKVVQRLPVRIELTNFDPDKTPLFIGLSVEPRVYFKEKASGPNAGEFLQPNQSLPQRPTTDRLGDGRPSDADRASAFGPPVR